MKKFLIASLAVAGFSAGEETAAMPADKVKSYDSTNKFQNLLDRALPFSLAGHRSHSSHGSHRSHRSSGGGSAVPRTYTPPPAPSYSPPSTNRNKNSTPPSSILPNSPAINLPKIKGNSAQFQRIVQRLQMMLYAYGFYSGALDGIAGSDTRAAIAKYQSKNGLEVTGQVDENLIKSLGISVD